MRTEEIACEKDLLLRKPGDHGFRPMNPWKIAELKRLVSKLDRLAVLHDHDPVFRHGKQIHEQGFAFVAGDDFGHRVRVQYLRNAAGVILLGMIGNHIID